MTHHFEAYLSCRLNQFRKKEIYLLHQCLSFLKSQNKARKFLAYLSSGVTSTLMKTKIITRTSGTSKSACSVNHLLGRPKLRSPQGL